LGLNFEALSLDERLRITGEAIELTGTRPRLRLGPNPGTASASTTRS
jgi:hypothetical protein